MNKKYLIFGGAAALLIVGGFYLLSGRMNEDFATESKINNGSTESSLMEEKDMTEVKMNLLETAETAGSFNTLVAAVKAAGLEDTLANKGPFTVFAPTDEAFAKLPEGTVETLLENPEKLAEILTYHVVDGKVMAVDVVKTDMVDTLNGKALEVMVENGEVMINDAKVITTDIQAENGIIHVIDSVLLPN